MGGWVGRVGWLVGYRSGSWEGKSAGDERVGFIAGGWVGGGRVSVGGCTASVLEWQAAHAASRPHASSPAIALCLPADGHQPSFKLLATTQQDWADFGALAAAVLADWDAGRIDEAQAAARMQPAVTYRVSALVRWPDGGCGGDVLRGALHCILCSHPAGLGQSFLL